MSLMIIATLLWLCMFASGNVPIPKREVGFVYNNGSPGAPVHIDLYIDQICPGSKAAWPTLLKVAEDYGPKKLQLTVHLFPLPYHRFAFLAAKGTHVVDLATNGELTFKWIDHVFDNLENLTTTATNEITGDAVTEMFATIAEDVGVSATTFKFSLEEPIIKWNARIGWKYACTRGIHTTPSFMVNDVVVDASSSWNLANWRDLIDKLL